MKTASGRALEEVTAREVMTAAMITVRTDMSIQEAAQVLIENEISGAPVVDEIGRFVGVLSMTDIARDMAEKGEAIENRFLRNFYAQGWEDEIDPEDMEKLVVRTSGQLVSDVMTPTIYTVAEGTPVVEITKTMISGRVHRLFVTREGKLAGIVTTLDVLKLMSEGR